MSNTALKLNEFRPGIHKDIPAHIYHDTDAISNGYLKRLSDCPAKAKIKQQETAAMIMGRAVHAYILEGDEAFYKEFAVAPKVDKRTKAGKETWAEFEAANDGLTLVKAEDFQTIQEMREAVYLHPLVKKMMAKGQSEVSVFWHRDEFRCKCRPDRIPEGGKGIILDLKTCASADEKAFTRTVASLGYHRQAAWYIDGLRANDVDVDAMVFIAVEKEAPYRTEVYVLDDEFVERGREEINDLLSIERRCREADHWPNYTHPGALDIFKPSWMV